MLTERERELCSKFVGIPYVPGGRKLSGCDCWGLVVRFYEEAYNIRLPEYREGRASKDILGFVGVESSSWVSLERDELQFGDLILIRAFGGGHLGIYVPENKMLHTMERRDSCIESLSSPLWSSNIIGFYRHKQNWRLLGAQYCSKA